MENKGIPYVPLQCQPNVDTDKWELIEAEFGLKGFAVIVKLLQRIYGQQGYYCEFTNEVALLFSKKIGLGLNAVSEIVEASIKRGFFDKEIFDKYKVLTSASIQEKYLEIVKRRKKIEIKKQYLLLNCANLPENAYIFDENVCINSKNADISETSKVKESKVKESKDNIGATAKPPPSSQKPKPPKHKRGEYQHVLLTDDEYSRLIAEYGEKITAEYIKRLDEYLENRRDKHYANHNLTIRDWLNKGGVKKLSDQFTGSEQYKFEGW